MPRLEIEEHNRILHAVQEGIENALDNGYDLLILTPEEVATDISTYMAGLEEVEYATLLPIVRNVLERLSTK